MNKYKYIFQKNLTMMLLVILVILIGFVLINLISNKKNITQNIGGSFLLKDHKGDLFDSKKVNKKN